MYEARTQEEILRELQAQSESPQAKFEGTFEYDVLASNSIEFAKVEVELEQAYKAAFADTAAETGSEYLAMRAEEMGVIRKAATYAHGEVTVMGTGTVLAGSIFTTMAGLRFAADEEVAVSGSGTVPVTAVEVGAKCNVVAGTIVNIPMNIPGISSVVNEEAMHDGYDEESDDDLLARYLLKVRTPATSGNRFHYIQWALEVEGVGNADCIPIWAGPGTVKVIIVDSNQHEASEELLATVYDHIEEVRPVGPAVTVVSAHELALDISVDALGTVDEEAFRDAVRTYLSELVKKVLFVSKAILKNKAQITRNRIGSILIEKGGAFDYRNLRLNGLEENIGLDAEDLPVLGEVTINVI